MTTSARLRVEVLGPIRVVDGGHDITPSGVLQRRLLALLVLRRGHVVSANDAIDALWPKTLPGDPGAALQNHLFRLRRSLGDDVIESVADGYRLDATRVDVDADELASTLADGDGDPAALDAVLARWHGPAYPELDDVDAGRQEALRLAELRTRARERRAEIVLSSGDAAGVVAELTALCRDDPLRERPRALLMSALAATGRQAEALRAFDEFRRLLGSELGISPSPELIALHDQVLAGGPAARRSNAVPVDAGSSPWAEASHLPRPTTSFVGRDELLAEIESLVATSPLTTLVGPGGVGKTRLLVEVGRRLCTSPLGQPVVMCELAPADDATAIDVVAAALGIDGRPGERPEDRIADVIGGTDIVLLLDNCEHVLNPVARFVEVLLARCANARVVATSRERLRLAGEHVRVVPPLECVAAPETGLTAATIPAIQLFVERARAVVAGFDPAASELDAISDIVRRLDGLPLAIELAAARLHTHDIGEVSAGLDRHRFGLLVSGSRTSPRHGSLGAAVSWSYGLLDDRLKRTFVELSVFAGSFDVDDAAAVVACDAATAFDALAQLVERSLVMRAPGQRYVLLETMRAFGREQLAESSRHDVVARRHACHFVEWIEDADRWLSEPGRPIIPLIDTTLPELRNALSWLLDHGEVDIAGRMVAALLDYCILRLRPDVLLWSERVLGADGELRSPLAPRVLVAAAYAAWMGGDVAGCHHRSELALSLVADRDGPVPAEVPTVRGTVALIEGDLEESVRWYQRGVDAAGDGDRQQRLMASSSQLLALGYAGDPSAAERAAAVLDIVADGVSAYAAYAWYCAGEAMLAVDPQLASDRYARALELADETGCAFVTGLAGASKASIDARVGDPERAAADYRRLILHWRKAGMWSTQWTMLRSIAGLLERLGRPLDAAVLEGAVRAPTAGHRIFGADEIALDELGRRLRAALGDEPYRDARQRGALLDGDAAVEHALRAL